LTKAACSCLTDIYPVQCVCKFVRYRPGHVCTILQESRVDRKILGARRVIWIKFHPDPPSNIWRHSTKFSRPGDLATRIGPRPFLKPKLTETATPF